MLRDVARSGISEFEHEHENNQSWISVIYQKLKETITSLVPTTEGWAIPAMAMAAVVVLVVSLTFLYSPTLENQIDTTYQTIYAQKTGEMDKGLRDFQLSWEEGGNVFAFSPAKSFSPATNAFGAGLLTAREALLGEREFTLPEPFESELKTEWASDFELGRWIFLLWTVTQFQREMPQSFWDEQREILALFKAEFGARLDEDAKKVVFQLENEIEPFLPQPNKLENYEKLGDHLKMMMKL